MSVVLIIFYCYYFSLMIIERFIMISYLINFIMIDGLKNLIIISLLNSYFYYLSVLILFYLIKMKV